jgi:hypothetical protein
VLQTGYQPIGTKPALDLAFAPRGEVSLAAAVMRDVPEIDLRIGAGSSPPGGSAVTPRGDGSASKFSYTPAKKTGCGCDGGAGLASPLVVLLWRRRRRRGPAIPQS